MAFKIGDTLIYFDSAVTNQERDVITPGKCSISEQLVVCNPKVAACQRKCGLNPATDTTVFGNAGYDIIPFGEAKICDIFDSCDTFADCLLAEKGFYIGKGNSIAFAQNLANYGTYICPGNIITFNNTTIHYTLSAGIGALSDSRYTTSYVRNLDLTQSGSAPHSFTSVATTSTLQSSNVMIVI